MNVPSLTSSVVQSPDAQPGGVLSKHQLPPPQDTSPILLLGPPRNVPRTTASLALAHYLDAAEALSSNLDVLGIRHAYIGNFAVDVLIETPGVSALLEQLVKRDPRFTLIENKLHCVLQYNEAAEPLGDKPPNSSSVPVQLSRTLTKGLPVTITSTYRVCELQIEVLHPAILIIPKFERWFANHASTDPQALRKAASDRRDIGFLISWLLENGEPIRFHEYHGKTKCEVLAMVRQYHSKYAGDVSQMAKLRAIMQDDWVNVLAPSSKHKAKSDLPP